MARTATFTVTLSEPSDERVSIEYQTVDLTATSPSDYTESNGVLTFEAGETVKTITSTGASEYTLTGLPYTFPNPKVFVNGVEHKKVRITGGLSKHWASGVTDPTLANTSNMTRSFKLIFDVDVPSSGATIVVQKSATVWANDYCHPAGPQGFWVLGQAAAKVLKDVN